MNLKLAFKISCICLLTLLLYSCGTQSNGMFEKRKHTKGWYFNNKKSFNLGSADSKPENKFSHEKKSSESDLAIRTSKKYRKSNYSKGNIDSLLNEKPLFASSVHKEEMPSIKNQSIHSRFTELEKDNSLIRKDAFNPSVKAHKLGHNPGKQMRPDPVINDNPRMFTAFRIILGLIGLYIVFGTISGVAMLLLLLLALADVSPLILIPLIIIFLYLVTSFWVYRILLLFRRQDEIEIWSLKKTFFNIGIVFFIISLIVLFAGAGGDVSF